MVTNQLPNDKSWGGVESEKWKMTSKSNSGLTSTDKTSKSQRFKIRYEQENPLDVLPEMYSDVFPGHLRNPKFFLYPRQHNITQRSLSALGIT